MTDMVGLNRVPRELCVEALLREVPRRSRSVHEYSVSALNLRVVGADVIHPLGVVPILHSRAGRQPFDQVQGGVEGDRSGPTGIHL